MKRTRRIDLTVFGDCFFYYSFSSLLIMLAIIFQSISLLVSSPSQKEIPLPIILVLFFSGILHYLKMRLACSLKVVDITFTIQELKKALEKTTKELDWNIRRNNRNIVEAYRLWGIPTAYNGEIIIILPDLKQNRIYIKSICESRRKARTLLGLFGRNRKNVNTFLLNLENIVKSRSKKDY